MRENDVNGLIERRSLVDDDDDDVAESIEAVFGAAVDF